MDPDLAVPMRAWHPAPRPLPDDPAEASKDAAARLRRAGFRVDALRRDGFRVSEPDSLHFAPCVRVRFRSGAGVLQVRYVGAVRSGYLAWDLLSFPVFSLGWFIDGYKRSALATKVHARLAQKRGLG